MKKRVVKLIAMILSMLLLLSGCGIGLIVNPIVDSLAENDEFREWYNDMMKEGILSVQDIFNENMQDPEFKENYDLFVTKLAEGYNLPYQITERVKTFVYATKARDVETVDSIFSEYAREFDGYYENMNAVFDFLKGDVVSIKYDCRGGFEESGPDNKIITSFFIVTTTEEEYLIYGVYTPLVEGDKQGKQKGMKKIRIAKLSDYDNYSERCIREGEPPIMGKGDDPILIWKDPEATE